MRKAAFTAEQSLGEFLAGAAAVAPLRGSFAWTPAQLQHFICAVRQLARCDDAVRRLEAGGFSLDECVELSDECAELLGP